MNISVDYEVLPLCMGPAKLCINVSRQTWAFVLPPKEDFRTLLPFFCLWTMFITETLGKEQKTLCKRLLTLRWNITMTKDFLTGLTVEWHPPPQIILDKQIGPELETYKTYGNLLPAPKNLGLEPDISQGPVMVIVTISFAIISHIIQACVPLPFVIAIRNLHNKTDGNGNLLQYSCLESPMDRGAWWSTVHGVAKSWTRLSDFTMFYNLY